MVVNWEQVSLGMQQCGTPDDIIWGTQQNLVWAWNKLNHFLKFEEDRSVPLIRFASAWGNFPHHFNRDYKRGIRYHVMY